MRMDSVPWRHRGHYSVEDGRSTSGEGGCDSSDAAGESPPLGARRARPRVVRPRRLRGAFRWAMRHARAWSEGLRRGRPQTTTGPCVLRRAEYSLWPRARLRPWARHAWLLSWLLGWLLGCNDADRALEALEARYAEIQRDASTLSDSRPKTAMPESAERTGARAESPTWAPDAALDRALQRGRQALDKARSLRAAPATTPEIFAWLTAARGWLAAAEAHITRQDMAHPSWAAATSTNEARSAHARPQLAPPFPDAMRALRRQRLTELIRERRDIALTQAQREERKSLYSLTIPGPDGMLDARRLPKNAARRPPFSVADLKRLAVASHRALTRTREEEARYFIEATQRLAPEAELPARWESRIVQGNATPDAHLAEVDALAREAFTALHRARAGHARQRGRTEAHALQTLVNRIVQLGFHAEVGPRGLLVVLPRAIQRASRRGGAAPGSPQATRLRALAKLIAPMPGPVAVESCAAGPRKRQDPAVAPLIRSLQANGIAEPRLWRLQRRCLPPNATGPTDADALEVETSLVNAARTQRKVSAQTSTSPAMDKSSIYLILPALGPTIDVQTTRFGEPK